jgi:uncharacterized protein (DUF58 family)
MTVHLTRVKARLSIHAHRRVYALLEGEYASLHGGRSMDFTDLREYVRGDDVKDIDWKASARSRALLVKRYAALRQHTILLAVSTGRSMAAMNDLSLAKRDLAVTTAGLFGYLAVRHGDLVTMAYGDADACHLRPPARGELALEQHLGAAYDATTPQAAPSDLSGLLEYVIRTVRRRTIMLVVADVLEVDERLAAALRRLRVQHEVLLVTVGDLDPTSVDLSSEPVRDELDDETGETDGTDGTRQDPAPDRPRESGDGGRPWLVDVESRQALPAWVASDPQLRQQYADVLTAEASALAHSLDRLGVVHAHVDDDASAIRTVFDLLETHRHARRG